MKSNVSESQIDNMRSLLAESPEGATHVDSMRRYLQPYRGKMVVYSDKHGWTNMTTSSPMRSLDDIRLILSLLEG